MTTTSEALEGEVNALRDALTTAFARGELTELEGWELEGVEAETFRGMRVPGIVLTRGYRTLHLYLLPRGTASVAHHTERYDVLYNDSALNRRSTSGESTVTLDQFLAWLDETFRAPVQSAPAPAPRAPVAVTPALAEELRALREALSNALSNGEITELAGWTLDGVEAETFRGHAVPGARLSRGDHTLHLHLLPAGSESTAHRTERYDVLYDDSARTTRATRGQQPVALDQLLAWLDATFRLPTEAAPTQAAQAAPSTPSPMLDIEVRTIRKALTGALSRDEIAELVGWTLDVVEVETFRGRSVPGIRLSRGAHTLHLHLLPRGADASAHRTNRYDVLYDDSARARGVEGLEPVVLDQFLSWLDGALVTREPTREGAAARVALAREVEAALTAALKADAVLGVEGWTLEHVTAREQSMGSNFVEVAFRSDERMLSFHVMPTNPEARAYRRTTRLDLLYEEDPLRENADRDRALIDGFADWLAAWDTPQLLS